MKSKNSDCIFLNPSIVSLVKECFNEVTLEHDFVAVYEEHIPTICILVINGKVNLYKNKRKIKTYTQNTLIGLQHLKKFTPVKYTWKISAHSKVIFIDQSSLKILQSILEKYSPSINATC